MGESGVCGTVLVVEDDPSILETVADGLNLRGYCVLTARDGVKALSLLASVPVGLIVLDLSMPIMSGWEFLEARSGDPRLASIPVVVVSGAGVAHEGPWNAFLRKPFVVAQLAAAIERCRSV